MANSLGLPRERELMLLLVHSPRGRPGALSPSVTLNDKADRLLRTADTLIPSSPGGAAGVPL